jgi:hypothetical protein
LCTFVVFDLEFTSWQGALEQDWAAPGQLRDGVQIGVLRLHEDFSVAEEFTEAEQGFQPHAAEAVDIADASNDAREGPRSSAARTRPLGGLGLGGGWGHGRCHGVSPR